MENVIVLMYFEDESYGRRLLRFFLSKRNPRLHPELITKKEKLNTRVGTERQQLVILTDCEGQKEDERKKIIYLTNRRNREKGQIFRYQKANGIYEDFLDYIGVKNDVTEPVPQGEEKTDQQGIYCFFSSDGGSATPLAVSTAQYLGTKGKCLYLSLDEFPLFYENEISESPDFTVRGISNLIFQSEEALFLEKERDFVQRFGSAWMLAPMVHYKDLLDCSWKDMECMIKRLQCQCGYEYIIIELSQLFEFTLELMEQCSRVFVVNSSDLCGRIRTAVFRRYCQLEKKEKLEHRLETVAPMELQEWIPLVKGASLDEMVKNRPWMKQIQRMLEQERKEGEDDCIIEFAG